jgi:glutathione peroxidase
MKNMITLILAAALAGCAGPNHDTNKTTETMNNIPTKDSITSIHTFTVKALDGTSINFAAYKGKKILVVNTASECGYTPQYKDLQALYEKYKGKLVIVGFPANNFGGQEPGSNTEIKSFCEKNYGVTFPMAEKISVKGDDMAPIYQWLTQKSKNGVLDATIKWNFNKFLLDENGHIIAKFDSGTKPMDDEIVGKL